MPVEVVVEDEEDDEVAGGEGGVAVEFRDHWPSASVMP